MSSLFLIETSYNEDLEEDLKEITSIFGGDEKDEMQKLLQKIQLWIEREIRSAISKPDNFLNSHSKEFSGNFPSLGGDNKSSSKKPVSSYSREDQRSVINELQFQEKEKIKNNLSKDPQTYIGAYTPGQINLQDKWNNISNNIFKTSKVNSEKEVQKLAEFYPNLDLRVLKFIYIQLSESFDDSFCFLKEHYSELYIKPQRKNLEIQKSRSTHYSENFQFDESEDIPINFDKSLLNMSVNELRSIVIKHKGIQYIFNKSYRDASFQKSHHDASKFKNFANEQEMILKDYQAASKAKYLHELRSQKNFYSIDLHHFFLDEAIDLLGCQIKYILNGLKTGQIDSHQYKSKEINHTKWLILEVITGKGLHSKNGKAILFPGIVEYVSAKGIKNKGAENSGKLEIYLPVK